MKRIMFLLSLGMMLIINSCGENGMKEQSVVGVDEEISDTLQTEKFVLCGVGYTYSLKNYVLTITFTHNVLIEKLIVITTAIDGGGNLYETAYTMPEFNEPSTKIVLLQIDNDSIEAVKLFFVPIYVE